MAPSVSPLLAASSLLCNLAVLALLANTHIELGAVRAAAAASQPRRGLLEPPAVLDDSFRVRLDEWLEESLGARVEALERRADGLSARADGVDDVIASLVELEQAEPRAAGPSADRAEAAGSDDARTVAADEPGQAESERRRAQGAEPLPEQARGENVKIIKPRVVRCGAHPPEACSSDDGGKHRRAQSAEEQGQVPSCDLDELTWRSGDIDRECCDEPSEDCTGGHPQSCNAGCAALFLPFWAECRAALGKDSPEFEPVVAMCEAAASIAPSLAQQLNVACSDGTAASECVPECCELLHGALMLLNIEGHDSKFACELRHGLYSWVGPAVRSPRHAGPLCALVMAPPRS